MAIVEQLSFGQLVLCFSLLVIPLLYVWSSVCKYYIKILVYYSLSLLIGLGVCVYSISRPRDPRNHFFVSWCVRNFLKQILGTEIEIRGKEKFKENEAAIVVINHQSSVDMLPLFEMWPENAVTLAKRELLYFSGTFGFGAWLCGTIYIKRGNSKSARNTMDGVCEKIKQDKLKVVIFPEGTRNHHGSLLPFKKGAFHLAVQSQVPIIPVVFSSYDNFYSKVTKRFNEGKIIVQILDAIPTAGLGTEDVTELTEKTRQVMLKQFEKISQEVNEDVFSKRKQPDSTAFHDESNGINSTVVEQEEKENKSQ